MKNKIIENMNKNTIKDILLKINSQKIDENEVDEEEEIENLKISFTFLNLLFDGINYSEEYKAEENAILCSVNGFIDYLDEFIYLYENKRYTMINQCIRTSFECFLALLTIIKHPHGLDMLLNNSDDQEKKMKLDFEEYYKIGDKEKILNEYKEKIEKRKSKKTIRYIEQVKLYKGNEEYHSGDLYNLYRMFSAESHFNINIDYKKRNLANNMKIKTDKPSVYNLTLPLHMNIIINKVISLIFEYVYNHHNRGIFKNLIF